MKLHKKENIYKKITDVKKVKRKQEPCTNRKYKMCEKK